MKPDRCLESGLPLPVTACKPLTETDREASLEEDHTSDLVEPETRTGTKERRRRVLDQIAVGPRRGAEQADLDGAGDHARSAGREAELQQLFFIAFQLEQSLAGVETGIDTNAVGGAPGESQRATNGRPGRRQETPQCEFCHRVGVDRIFRGALGTEIVVHDYHGFDDRLILGGADGLFVLGRVGELVVGRRRRGLDLLLLHGGGLVLGLVGFDDDGIAIFRYHRFAGLDLDLLGLRLGNDGVGGVVVIRQNDGDATDGQCRQHRDKARGQLEVLLHDKLHCC